MERTASPSRHHSSHRTGAGQFRVLILAAFLAAPAVWVSSHPTTFASPTVKTKQLTLAAKINRVFSNLAKLHGSNRFSGSVLVARRGTIVISKGYGLADSTAKVKNTPQTKFRIGSVTKQFTATAILLLQERGKLSVTDTVCLYVARCPETWKSITIQELLTHTSGIPNFTELPNFPSWAGDPLTPEGIIAHVKDLPLDFPPGTSWKYSNTGYILLGMIIEKQASESYARFIEENIVGPLRLTSTDYDRDSPPIPNHAVGYSGFDDLLPWSMSVAYAAGALYSTTLDLYAWDQALFGGRVLSERSLEAMTKPAVRVDPGIHYGYGLFIRHPNGRHPAIGHGGAIPGFLAEDFVFPRDGVTVILLSNNDRAALDAVLDIVVKLIFPR